MPLLTALLVCTAAISPAWEAPKKDWFIFLESGRPAPADREEVAKMQAGHLNNFTRLFEEGKLFGAGPLRDPEGRKRGIVWVKADSHKELLTYFEPDQYVRDGYMIVNAVPCRIHKPLNTEGIDPNGIEEVRIIQITRPARMLSEAEKSADQQHLQKMLDKGQIGAWYTLESGPVSEVLFCRTTDSNSVKRAFQFYPSARTGDASIHVWSQWLGKGVIKQGAQLTNL